MKCCYITKKGPCSYTGKKEFPPNSFIHIPHSFCKIHYNQLLGCRNFHSVEQFYKIIVSLEHVLEEEIQRQDAGDTILV